MKNRLTMYWFGWVADVNEPDNFLLRCQDIPIQRGSHRRCHDGGCPNAGSLEYLIS